MSGTIQPPIQTGTLQINSGNAIPVTNGYYPPEGSRVCSTSYNFTTQATYFEDLSKLLIYGIETTVQSIWIDNSANLYPVTIFVGGSQQQIVLNANSQGIFPLFANANGMIWLQSSGGSGLTNICLLNVPCNIASQWSINQNLYVLNGSALGISSFRATKYYHGAGGFLIPALTGYKWFVSSIYLSFNDSSTINGGAGYLGFNLQDGSGNLIVYNGGVYFPASSGTKNRIYNIALYNLNLISQSFGNAINLNFSTYFTNGGCDCTVTGGYTTSSQ